MEVCYTTNMQKEYHFIVNTHSKTGKAAEVWRTLEQELRRQGASYTAHITQYAGHAAEIAAELTSGETPVFLVVAGGDGTVNEVLSGIRDLSLVTLGYLPLGSANDLARGLGLTDEPLEILRQILNSTATEAIDVGEVSWEGGSRRFAVSAGAGVDAAVCRRALTSPLKTFLNRIGLGGLTYGLLTISELFRTPRMRGVARMADGSEVVMDRMIFCAAMNFACEGGGVRMAPHASAKDGKLSVCCVCNIPKVVCLFAFVLLLMGKHEKIRGFVCVDTEELRLSMDRSLVVHADGEDCGDQQELTFRCLPNGLLMPRLLDR